MTQITEDGMVERVKVALEEADDYCAHVQGFHYGDEFVVRDLHKPVAEQAVFRTPYSTEAINENMAWVHGKIKARAVIAAMREPTEAMIEAGVSADHGKTLGDRVANCHRAMIDAALTPPTQEGEKT